MTDTELAWAAGLFEGEGSIVHNTVAGKAGQRRRRLALEMKDQDVILRFAEIVDGGCLYVVRRSHRVNEENWSDLYKWECGRWEDTERILKAFLPYLGERRRAKAEALLADPAGPVGRPPRISEETREAIRAAWAAGTKSQNAIAREFGVHQSSVSRFINSVG